MGVFFMKNISLKCFTFGLIIGLTIGVILMVMIQRNAGKIRIDVKFPPVIEYDACGSPHQVPINFGHAPSIRSLGEALKIIEERTQGRGVARIYVDKKIYESNLALVNVKPPSGSFPSLELINQLIASANAFDKIRICLVPGGGYIVCLCEL